MILQEKFTIITFNLTGVKFPHHQKETKMGKVKNYYHDEICRMAEEDNFPDDIEYQIWNEAEKPKIQTTQKPIKETK